MELKKTDEKGPDLGVLLCMQEQMGAGEWRMRSDAAQVIANYLRCHPKVAEVRYPGLTSDASYHEASCTLRGGFGPYIWLRLRSQWFVLDATAEDVKDQVLDLERILSK
ncbi:hypothetical protein [Paratractidigestivibacter sp.]|uniref:hypothetical protein n=1 Tax=Paratractidigestivibacter sp. TaxID=2847316 RepID=UPI002AC99C1C|nr:hypothetical protein [Paratractidigestivibacter sp.]